MTTVAQQRWIELITIENAIEIVGDNSYPYLRLQRYAFDRAKFGSLTAQELLWHRGYNDSDYNAFLMVSDDKLDNIDMTYDVVACHLRGPVIVAIKKGTYTAPQHVFNAINRTQIMQKRVF